MDKLKENYKEFLTDSILVQRFKSEAHNAFTEEVALVEEVNTIYAIDTSVLFKKNDYSTKFKEIKKKKCSNDIRK